MYMNGRVIHLMEILWISLCNCFLSSLLVRRMECLNRVLVLTLLCWPSGSGLEQDCGACAAHQLTFSWLPDATQEHASSSRSSRSNEGSCVTSYYRWVHSCFHADWEGGAATFLDDLTITRSKATSKSKSIWYWVSDFAEWPLCVSAKLWWPYPLLPKKKNQNKNLK